jgi:hypothetical protein
VTVAATIVAGARAEEPSAVEPLLRAAADYMLAYREQLAGVVLEETYVQDVRYQPVMRPGSLRAPSPGPFHRRLRSDLLLIRPEGATTWRQFRDVFEVDARPVRDRSDRLARLFLGAAATAEAQADQIARESARYNIGDIERNINLPLLTLLVLDRDNQPRFVFSTGKASADKRGLPRSAAFAPPADARVVAYEERSTPSMIRGAGGRSLPIHGRLWIEPASGRVRLTELLVIDAVVEAQIHVAYRHDAAVGLLVPAEMHERYDRADGMRIEGTAAYANVRRFQVKTDENLTPIR